LANFFIGKGQFEEAEQLNRQALAIYQEMGEQLRFIRAAYEIGITLNLAGKFAESRALLEENLSAFQELADHRSLALLKNEMACSLLHLGEYKQATAYAQQSLAHFQETSIPWLGVPLLTLGQVALAQEMYAEAHQFLQESLSKAGQAGDPLYWALPLANLAYVERGQGHSLQARRHLQEALQVILEKEIIELFWYSLPIASLLLADQDEKAQAIELYNFALQNPFVANSRWFEDIAGRHIAAIAATLPPEVVEAAQARGRARDLWETASELLAELEAELR
jgi:tetratricopeptide (TPR) repeat protein